MLFKKNVELIPIRDITITKDENETIGYDFTVENDYTFCTHDGVFVQDSMGLIAPISEEAQKECRQKLMTATSNFGVDSQNFQVSNEMILGIYSITKMDNGGIYTPERIDVKRIPEDKYKELRMVDAGKRVKIMHRGKTIETTVGKVLFNALLPEYIDFINETTDKKMVNKILVKILGVNKNDYAITVQKLMQNGFFFATIYPKSISLKTVEPSKEILKLKEKLSKETDIKKQMQIVKEMEKELEAHLKKNHPNLYDLAFSGASKSISQISQIVSAKGVTRDSAGNILKPVAHSFVDGLDPEEYFNLGAPARSGVISKALNTAMGGYEYRKAIYLCGNIKANVNLSDCGTTETLNIKLTKELFKRLTGRYVLDMRNRPIPVVESMIGDIIRLRSPIYCQSWKICRTCYGDLLYQINSENVGIIAAQSALSLSERFMKCSCGTIIHDNKILAFEDFFDE